MQLKLGLHRIAGFMGSALHYAHWQVGASQQVARARERRSLRAPFSFVWGGLPWMPKCWSSSGGGLFILCLGTLGDMYVLRQAWQARER